MDFKFEIGSFVRLEISEAQKDSVAVWDVTKQIHTSVRGQIVSRDLEECTGGIQRHYAVRWTTSRGDIHKDLVRHNEIELVASLAFPVTETKD